MTTNRSRLALLGGGVVAAGLLLLTAPTASAISEQTIKSECEDIGGTYNTAVVKGHRYSSCDYTIDGDWKSDTYTDGEYTGTLDRETPPSPTKAPVAQVPPLAINPGLAPV